MALHQITMPIGPFEFDAWVGGPADAEPVLLLHGFPECAWTWRHVQAALVDEGYATLAPDQRGYSPGARPTAAADYSMGALVGDVLAYADAMGWEGFHLVGHDWGGAVAWQVAGRHPERVLTLTAVSTPHPRALAMAKAAGPGPDGDDQAERGSYIAVFRQEGSEHMLLADDGAVFRFGMAAAGLDEDSIEHYYARLSTPEAMAGPLGWYRGADLTDVDGLGPITVPTLYVWSTDDIALGRLAAELTAEQVEGPYRFEVLEGVSHWIPSQAADLLVPLLLDHIAP